MSVRLVRLCKKVVAAAVAAFVVGVVSPGLAIAQEPASAPAVHRPGGEANLVLPDLSQVTFLGGVDGHTLLLVGLVVSALGLVFGLVIYGPVSYTHLRAHETVLDLVCRLLLEKKNSTILSLTVVSLNKAKHALLISLIKY